jgi:hypothetical protein
VATPAHLVPLPEQLRRLGVPDDVLALATAEHDTWRALHDRLIGLIAALLDLACRDRPVAEVVDELIGAAAVPLDRLVGAAVDPAEVAALLRAHGSLGSVTTDAATGTVEFRHACGSGQRYWRGAPDAATVADGEVPGVPGGRPRYCARCVRAIAAHGGDAWTVAPPPDAVEPCVWRVRTDLGPPGR